MGKNNENENVHVERLDNTQVRHPVLQKRFLKASPTEQIQSRMEAFDTKQPTISTHEDTEKTRYRQYKQNAEWATDLLRKYFPEEYERIQSQKSAYLRFNESNLGKTLDWVDLGLDIASMAPGHIGAAASIAGTITGLPQGIFGLYDGFTNGFNYQNFSDAMKIVPGGSIANKMSNGLLRVFGKTDKYARRLHPYFKTKVGDVILPSGINMVKKDKKYLPYFLPKWGADTFNITDDIIHISQ